jgi:NADH-quinone oxidoreductase subunit L
MSPLFELSETALSFVIIIGAITALFMGFLGMVQNDIKRVVAYSTLSQLGYMTVALGASAYSAAIFHLMTHAFFKALLFLAAGIVIHALAGEQDMRRMGGLRRLMPKTAVAMWIGGLALVGIPPFAGFFSKDSILAAALGHGWYGVVLWVCGMAGAFLTGLYTFRMIFLVFGGEPSAYVREHPPHMPAEAAPRLSMAWAVGALSILSVVGGWLQFAGVWTSIANWLDPVARPLVTASGTQEAISSIFAVGFGLAGIASAWWIYVAKKEPPPQPAPVLEKKFYFDELYDALFYKPAVYVARGLFGAVEGPLVAGSVAGVAGTTRALGRGARSLQTGLVRNYVFALAAGLAVLAVVFIAVR